jgi:hypothetical protein
LNIFGGQLMGVDASTPNYQAVNMKEGSKFYLNIFGGQRMGVGASTPNYQRTSMRG